MRNNIKISLISLAVAIFAVTISYAAPKSGQSKKPSPALAAALLSDQAGVEAVEKITPSLVSIIVKEKVRTSATTIVIIDTATGETKTLDQPAKDIFQEAARGSGVIVDSRGYILTNKHVVNFKDALIKVFLANGDIVDGYIVDIDPASDLALIKISGGPYEAATLGDSDVLSIGQSVMAIGYSLGRLENTVTRGIVSGVGRVFTADLPGGTSAETISDTIQTDASINKGNSGGPLINLRGEVIGINTAIEQVAQGIGYTIPINIAKPAIKSALQTGKIVRARVGVRYVMITPAIREENALVVKEGAFLVRARDGSSPIVEGGPAARAGLQDRDIIIEVNGMPLTISHSLQGAIARFQPNDIVTLTIVRNGAKLKVPVTLDKF